MKNTPTRLMALTGFLLGSPGLWAALPAALREDVWVADGSVNAIVRTGGKIYLGGNFTSLGAYTGHGVPVSLTTGRANTTYPKFNGDVLVSVSDGAGGFYVGGNFTQSGATPRNRLARVLSDGTLDPAWNPGADGSVRALVVSNGKVYVGGAFTTLGGGTRNRVGALNATTGALDTAWNPDANGTVNALSVSAGKVYLAGAFTRLGTTTRNRLAAVTTSGILDPFDPDIGLGTLTEINAMVVTGGRIYVGGYFGTVGPPPYQVRYNLAAFDESTGSLLAWAPRVSDSTKLTFPVRAMVYLGGKVYVGGEFDSLAGGTRNGLGAVDAITGALDAWNHNLNGYVYSLVVSGSKIVAGGNVYIRMLDATTGSADAWNPSAAGSVRALAVNGSTVFVGGEFINLGGRLFRSGLAAMDEATGAVDPNWNPMGTGGGGVNVLTVSGGKLYLGGTFRDIAGTARNCLGAVNIATGALDPWNPNVVGAFSRVNTMVVNGNKIFWGGQFISLGGGPPLTLGAVDATTGATDSNFPNAQGGPTAEVYALEASGGKVYVGGNFTSLGTAQRNFMGAVDAVSGVVDPTWNPNPNSPPQSMKVGGGKIYLGGIFTQMGGTPRNRLAAVDATSGALDTWNPDSNGIVNTLAVYGGQVLVGGSFTNVGGTTRNRAAVVDALTGALDAWNPNADNDVLTFSPSATNVLMGGLFSTMGDVPRASIAWFGAGGGGGDTTPPIISGLTTSGITTSGATVQWSTNEGSDSQVEYGPTTGYGSVTTLNTGLVTSHSQGLTGLTAGTLYHYRVKSRDAAGNLATSSDGTFTTVADNTPPVISAVTTSGLATTNATVNWTTDEGSDSQVEYGLTTGYGSATTLNASRVTSHSETLSGLTAGTLYHFRVKSRDAAGNLATSGDGTFTTSSGGGDVTAPVISGLTSGGVTTTGATIQWTTNEAADTRVEYGLTASYGSATVLNISLVTSHSQALTGLTAGTLYHYRAVSKDATGNQATSADGTFTTSSGGGGGGGQSGVLDNTRAYPNPFKAGAGPTDMTFDRMPAGTEIKIYGVRGRMVRSLVAEGSGQVVWDLKDEEGQPIKSGVYSALITTAGEKRLVKVLIQK